MNERGPDGGTTPAPSVPASSASWAPVQPAEPATPLTRVCCVAVVCLGIASLVAFARHPQRDLWTVLYVLMAGSLATRHAEQLVPRFRTVRRVGSDRRYEEASIVSTAGIMTNLFGLVALRGIDSAWTSVVVVIGVALLFYGLWRTHHLAG